MNTPELVENNARLKVIKEFIGDIDREDLDTLAMFWMLQRAQISQMLMDVTGLDKVRTNLPTDDLIPGLLYSSDEVNRALELQDELFERLEDLKDRN